MVKVLIYLIFGVNAVAALGMPWVGVVLAYLMTLLTPQNIWWWAFEGVRPALWIVLPTIAGFIIAVMRGKIDYSILRTRLNACVFLLWFSSVIAYYFGPYVDVFNGSRFYDPDLIFSLLQKAFLTYFIAVLLIDNAQKLSIASLVMVVTAFYMTYWANAQYFLFGKFGRLHGPTPISGYSIYNDENIFAVLFVVGGPFLFYAARYLNRKPVSWLLWSATLFSWHAVFLTASRGALLGIVAVLGLFVMRQEKRMLGILVMCGFLVAFLWQAGDLMKGRSATITNYEQEDSASARVEAWSAAIGMMAAHPLTGVGFASFGQAYPDFSDKTPRIAHNTFFQIGGEWGIAAGVTYLVLIFSTLNRLRKNGTRLRGRTDQSAHLYYCVNEACLLALLGFFVCSMFLSLEKYEVLYYLLVLSNATLIGSGRLLAGDASQEPAPQSARGIRRFGLAVRGR